MLISSGNKEVFNGVHPIGIGLIETSINLSRICLFNKPDFLLFFGSAGSYGKYNVFDVVESSSSANIELSFLQDDSYTPINNACDNEINFCKNETIVNSSNYITTNFELAKKYNDYGIGIENMEFFSIMMVAKAFEIPVGGVFVISNLCDKNAHDDYLKNMQKTMHILNSKINKV